MQWCAYVACIGVVMMQFVVWLLYNMICKGVFQGFSLCVFSGAVMDFVLLCYA